MTLSKILRRPLTWVIAVPVLVLLVAVVGPFVYVELIEGDPPGRLGFEDSPTTQTTPTDDDAGSAAGGPVELDGKWTVVAESEAGYRVDEVLFGRDTEAVGRTNDVTGQVSIEGRSVTDASFTVDMTTVTSDQDRRDRQFHGRIMETATYPTATFVLTTPVEIGNLPADGEEVTVPITGDFTIHGVKRSVTLDLQVRPSGSSFQVKGNVPVSFDDYDIPDASFGPATVKDDGEIEFLLTLKKS